ncbi:TspO/MBR family protein [Picosynechococcus sp. NKBG15041c]|uniref:TspO/MBR family protein n=1 Tax=Picosynechococcus sp. NKBG15041c TaxID=1407650 RepID=UPI00040082AD|nr:tryptophan-rich sensory protein [Picosynechococcus sp. NKBG15041c]
MLGTGLLITLGAIALGVGLNRLICADQRWFFQLRRPAWLTFEGIIPVVWTSIFICGIISANYVWHADPQGFRTWLLMAGYGLLELVILAYTPLMCKTRSLTVGTIIGAAGFVVGLLLAIAVLPISPTSFWLLVPFLVWSPIGTYITWEMIWLNPGKG